jgi:hypothetical protein
VADKSSDLARFMQLGHIDHRAHPFVFYRMAATAAATTTAGGTALENYNLSWKGRQQVGVTVFLFLSPCSTGLSGQMSPFRDWEVFVFAACPSAEFRLS